MQEISINKTRNASVIVENVIIFLIMGLTYMGLEMLWRGYTFLSMGLVGGLAGLSIGLINEREAFDMPLLYQGMVGTVIVVILEFVSGLILNVWLNLNVWDYSHMPYNLMGQVCLYFTLLWFVLSIACIVLDDWIRVTLFNKDKPQYTWIKTRN